MFVYSIFCQILVEYNLSIQIKGLFMFNKQEHYNKVLSSWKPIREKIYWVIVKITNDKSLAEDVLQEALITAIDKFQTLKDE